MPSRSAPNSSKAAPLDTSATNAEWLREGWDSPNEWKIRLARLAYRYRIFPWILAWVAMAGSTMMAACQWYALAGFCPQVLPWLWWTGFAGLLGIGLISAAFIVMLSGWFGVRFRYVAWGTASFCGAVARALRAGWRALLLLGFFLLMVLDYKKIDQLLLNASVSSWKLLATSLALLAATFMTVLLWTGYQVRNRILLHEIKNHTGCPDLEACAKGLSERLCSEFAGLAQLYGLINRSQGIRRKSNVYGPSIDVQDPGGLLESTMSTQAILDLKFFKIPVGSLLPLGSRLLQGARLSGSLHKYGTNLLLVAQMTGAGRDATTWRVATADLDEEDQKLSLPLILDRMIEQMACRIAADLLSIGSRKWRAVYHFTNALRVYRSAQGTKNDKRSHLREAELAFLKALSEDREFAQCHYNLGIIYHEMEKDDAADAAFRRALREDAEPDEACYALAARYFQDDRFADALWFSWNAIRILPDNPMAWHLYSMSLYYGRTKIEMKAGKPGRNKDWENSLEAEAMAVGIAWRNFCRWQMKGLLADRVETGLSSSGDHRQTAAAFTGSLANGILLRDFAGRRGRGQEDGPVAGEGKRFAKRDRARQKGQRTRAAQQAWELIRQAVLLSPSDSANYFSWARVLWRTGDLPGATRMLDHVFAGRLEDDERIAFWSMLLAVHAALMILLPDEPTHHNIARDACDYLLDIIAAQASGSIESLSKELENARDRLKQALAWATASRDEKAGSRSSSVERFAEELAKRPGETPVERTRRLLLSLESNSASEPASYLWRLHELLIFIEKVAGVQTLKELQETEEGLNVLQEELRRDGLLANERTETGFGPAHFFQAHRGDCEWACSQIAVRLGLAHLNNVSESGDAERCLTVALNSIADRQHHHQIVDQWLQSRQAEAFLLKARAARETDGPDGWTNLLQQGLEKAEQAVTLEPAGFEEHKILGKLYFELGDYQRAEEEWKICIVLKPDDHEVLNRGAEAAWRRGLDLADAQARRQAFRGAIKIFEEARELVEKNPSSSTEAHGQIHFWLGVFHRELLHFDQAIFNHKVAWSLGVRPLEARTSLAWAYLEAGMYGEALATFQAVLREARRELAKQKKPEKSGRAAGPGQEMPLDEIMLRTLLGYALHDAELGVCLKRAERLIGIVPRHVRGVRRYKRAELLARCHECLGLIRLQQYESGTSDRTHLEGAIRQLRRALQLHARCDTYLLLARIHLNQGKVSQGSPKHEEMEQARRDCERARGADLRCRRGNEIKDLLQQIDKEDNVALVYSKERLLKPESIAAG